MLTINPRAACPYQQWVQFPSTQQNVFITESPARTPTPSLCTLSRFSLQCVLCVCAALWQPDHVTITPLRCHKHCLFNTALLSLSACKKRGGVIVVRGRYWEEWEQAAKEGFVVACVFTGRGPLWHSLSEKQQMHAWRRTSAEFTDQKFSVYQGNKNNGVFTQILMHWWGLTASAFPKKTALQLTKHCLMSLSCYLHYEVIAFIYKRMLWQTNHNNTKAVAF